MELDTGRHRSGQGRLINSGINRALTIEQEPGPPIKWKL